MSTWYRINIYTTTIVPVEVVSVTDKYIRLDAGPRAFQFAKQDEYFPTFRQARSVLMEYYSQQHQELLAEAEQAHEKFTKVFMMDEPAEK